MLTSIGRVGRLKPMLMACAAGATLLASPTLAQERRVDGEKILELLVAKGVITQDDASSIIAQAEVVEPAPVRAPIPQAGVAADGTQTVAYVSPVVREQIAQQVRAELGTQAQAEGWSKPGETPEWTRRISIYGDVRVRGEGRFYDKDNGDIFWNYGRLNHGDPFDINDANPDSIGAPYVNTLENRQRFRLRARLGVKAQIAEWISADVRIATGADNAPVSTNQTLGADGTGKYQLWLDRASIRLTPVKDVNIDLGRFANPFWSSDLIFDNDMNFDGVAISGSAPLNDGVRFFGTAGAFPVFNTDMNFGTQNARVENNVPRGRAYKSQDRYLLAAQAGVEFKPADQVGVKLAGAYYRYTNIQGRLSEPCYWYELVCSTDALRPAFQQFGNTMTPLRDIVPNPINPDLSPEPQYFGYASKFQILHVRSQLEYRPSPDGFGLRLEGDYVRNLGWNGKAIRGNLVDGQGWVGTALNNLGPDVLVPAPTTENPNRTIAKPGAYQGGNEGWQARLTVGTVMNLNMLGDWQAKRGDWNAYVAYRRLESDAVVDAFADSDFHIGGTNNRGWQIGGNYGIAKNTIVGFRWLSAEEIASAPFSVDRGFVDLMTRF
ncbi:putative porin [Sphingopyxis sp. R3-92]|uniref:putative porin n=1 Tax=Sphingopyxis sp. R3-92 TaxID=3158553 RepID=UPI003EE5A6D3